MGNVMYEEYNALPQGEKDYWGCIARAKNEEIRLEVESVRVKFRAYDKVGPLGSLDKRYMVDIDQLSDLLNMENSPLADMWKADDHLGYPP